MINIYISPKILAFLLSFLVSNSPQIVCVLWFSSCIFMCLRTSSWGFNLPWKEATYKQFFKLNDQFCFLFFVLIIFYFFPFIALDPPVSPNEYLTWTVWLSYKENSSTSNFNLIVLKKEIYLVSTKLHNTAVCETVTHYNLQDSSTWSLISLTEWNTTFLNLAGAAGRRRRRRRMVESRTHIQPVFRFSQQKGSWFSLGLRYFQSVEQSQVYSVGIFGWRGESLWFCCTECHNTNGHFVPIFIDFIIISWTVLILSWTTDKPEHY